MMRAAITALVMVATMRLGAGAGEPEEDVTDAARAAARAGATPGYDGQLAAAECWLRAGCAHRARRALEAALSLNPHSRVAQEWLVFLTGHWTLNVFVAADAMSAKEAHLAGLLVGFRGDVKAEQAFLARARLLDSKDARIAWDFAVAGGRRGESVPDDLPSGAIAAARVELLLGDGRTADAAAILGARAWNLCVHSPHMETLRRLASADAVTPAPPPAVAVFTRSPRFKVAAFMLGLGRSDATKARAKLDAYYAELEARSRDLSEEHAGTIFAPEALLAAAATFCEFSGAGHNRMGDADRRALAAYFAVVAMAPNLPKLADELPYLARLFEAVEGPAEFEGFASAWRRRCVSDTIRARIDLERFRMIRRSGDREACRALLPTMVEWVTKGASHATAIEREVRFARLELAKTPLPIFGAVTTVGIFAKRPGRRWTLLEVSQPDCAWCEQGADSIQAAALDRAHVDVLSLVMHASDQQKAEWATTVGWAVITDPETERIVLEQTRFTATPAYCLLDDSGAIVMVGQGVDWAEAIVHKLTDDGTQK